MAVEAKASFSTDMQTVLLSFKNPHLTSPTVVFFKTAKEAREALLSLLPTLECMEQTEKKREAAKA